MSIREHETGETRMCDSGTQNDGKKLRVFGPAENPDEANCYMGEADGDLSAVVECLRSYFKEMDADDRIVFRVQMMTDAEVEALPDI